MASRPLNIWLITTDQQRGDCTGFDGNRVIQTRCLDRLAHDPCGAFFGNAYAEAPVCVPQRTAWMLGQHPLTCRQNRWRAQEWKTAETLSGALAAQGWHCGVFGKRHFHPVREPYGFHEMKIYESGRNGEEPDDYLRYLREHTDWGGYSRAHGVGNNDVMAAASLLPEREYPSSWIARESTGFLERHVRERAGKPFFLWTSFNKPHSPYDPPQPYDRLYRPQDMPAPCLAAGGPDSEIAPLQRAARHYTWDTQGAEQMRAARAYYYGMITHIDHCIERCLTVLDRIGERENTVIAFTSDHGDMMGDHGVYFKGIYHEGSARVPYLWWIPAARRKELGLQATGRLDAPVGVSTLAPTLLEIAGAEAPASMNAGSLGEVFAGKADAEKAEVVAAYDAYQNKKHSAMLRWANWKYIYWQFGGIAQLFDLSKDRGELNNLAADPKHRDRAAQAHARLEKRLAQYPAGREEVLDAQGRLQGVPFEPPDAYSPPIRGPWGRRPF